MTRYMIYMHMDAPGRLIRCGANCSLNLSQMETLVQRLAQYEDTGYTPEQIRELSCRDSRFQTFDPD